MKKSSFVLAVAAVTATFACHRDSDKPSESTATGNPQSTSLILAAEKQGAFLPPELADARLADEATLPMNPFTLPAASTSSAVNETEPNQSQQEASPLGPALIGRGESSQGDTDVYWFDSSGEPQIFAIEAAGKGITSLRYRDASSRAHDGQEVDSGRFVIANLFLSPGRHYVEVRATGQSARYIVRAVAMGAPDLRMEREPNDGEDNAHPLTAGITRVGLILESGDRDFYRFSLRQTEHVLLQVKPPSDLQLVTYLQGSELPSNISFSGEKPGDAMRFDGVLPAGDYVLRIGAYEGGSRSPYKVRLDRLDPFALPVDVEPNNDADNASPIPSDMILRGTVGEFNDPDWYRLPQLSQSTSMRVQVMGLSGGQRASSLIDILRIASPNKVEWLDWARRDSVMEATLPPNVPLFLRLNGPASYQVRLIFSPGIHAAPAAKLPLTISMPAGPHLVEAFSKKRQRMNVPVTLRNTGSSPLQLSFETAVSNIAWGTTRPARPFTVQPGKDVVVPMQVLIPPDAGAGEYVQVAVRVTSPQGQASATTKLIALCGANAVNPEPYRVLPPQLLGGIDVASLGLGAHPVASDQTISRERMLYDGITPNGDSWRGFRGGSDAPLTLTVALAGDHPVPVAGVTLIPGPGDRDQQVRDFDVLLSNDGQNFEQVASGTMSWARVEQAFVFPRPVSARFAQLRLRTNQGKNPTDFELGEFKVIEAPGESPFSSTAFNLADTAVGGYVVLSHPYLGWSPSILTDDADAPTARLDAANLNEWVVGFTHDRAAMISSLELVQPKANGNSRFLSTIDVSVSTESPLGPWTRVATWKIGHNADSTSSLDLPKPVWARFVRFSTSEPSKADEWWRLPETIRIREAPATGSYRSILGEWGHYSRDAIYERLVSPPRIDTSNEIANNNKRDDAATVELDKTYAGRVQLDKEEDWYEIKVPKGQNQLLLDLAGDPLLKASASLQDESGKPVAADIQRSAGRGLRIKAKVEGGEKYFLRVYEPPRSIALVWDNSGSISPYAATLYRALEKFVEVVQPKKEFVNLLPFQDNNPRFLLDSWSDQPFVLQGAVQNYGRQDGSSNAELSLLTAAQELQGREGNKAILFLTDAASNGYDKTSELWSALSDVQPQVFTVELHGGSAVRAQQHLMESWADANGGGYSVFRTSEDIDKAFDRASCLLRQPARYTLTASTRHEEPPAPGALEVALSPTAMANNAVELIFDASGSMLQQMGAAGRRIDIAKSVLTNLVQKTIPAGTPFAFRAFGTKKANCDTDLLLQPQPLDRSRVSTMIRGMTAINNAKTPIGASLRAVSEDLKGIKGQKVVILVTDGEETCGGDPPGAIKFLKDQGLDVRVNIVGFGVDEPALKQTFDRWAEMGGGRFFEAKNGQELGRALNDALLPKFQVLDASGAVIADGTAGGAAMTVAAGTYTVRVLTSPAQTFERVQIAPSMTKRIEVK